MCESFDVNKIPDDVFELCLKILNHSKYKFMIKTKDEKICFSSNVIGVCRNEWTVAKMLESLDNNEETIFKESNSELSFKSVAYICDGCNHSLCPKTALCVLSYYKKWCMYGLKSTKNGVILDFGFVGNNLVIGLVLMGE